MTGIRLLVVAPFLCAALASTIPASPSARAADRPYRVTIDGRRVDARTPSGRSRNGVLYINLVRAVKSFDGLLTFAPGGVAHVTIGVKSVDFRIGSAVARSGTARLHLPGPPFVADGDEFVPLATLASLASATYTIDRVHHVELLTSAADSPQSDAPVVPANGNEVVPSPAQALAVVTTFRIDAGGLHARADITNTTAAAYTVVFPSSHQVEFVALRDGAAAWVSSQGRSSVGQESSLVIAPRGTRTVTATWPDYAKAAAGRYTLRVRFLTPIPLDEPPVSLGVTAPATASAS